MHKNSITSSKLRSKNDQPARALLRAACIAGIVAATAAAASAQTLNFSWKELSPVPPNRSAWSDAIPVHAPWWRQIGLAGPITGVQHDKLIVAGGANFPEPGLTATRPNTLGKVYWDEVFVLNLKTNAWEPSTFKLPRALAYASTLSLPEGILVIGGEGHETPNGNAKSKLKIYADVFLIQLDENGQKIEFKTFPSLPRGVSYGAAALIGRTVYLQSASDFLALQLDALDQGWQVLPTWPGEARDLALAAGVGGKFIVASGRTKKDGAWMVHKDAFAYDPQKKQWSKLPDMPYPAQAGMAYSVQDRYMVVLSGDKNVERWNLQAALEGERGKAKPHTPEWNVPNTGITFAFDHHAGNNQAILVYDPLKGQWAESGYLPGPAPVTTQPVKWRNELLLVSGETNPGKRTPAIWSGLPKEAK